ncbi:putative OXIDOREDUCTASE domain protein [Mycobacterium xenopi 4042]|uniref:Putative OXIDOREDUCTASE domain protein n=1 Tax=Mycobacterium xenopi 4042 TaxID=1299334 RepID=X8BG56_MYCXE|nr:putative OXIDOREDUCTASE domain protein [Mycobacterium xenopi 4042]
MRHGLSRRCPPRRPRRRQRVVRCDRQHALGVTFTADSWDDVWTYVKRPDRRFTVDIPELVEQLRQLRTDEPGWGSEEFPMVLSAGNAARSPRTPSTAIPPGAAATPPERCA